MESVLCSPAFDLAWEEATGALSLTSPGRAVSGIAGVEVLRGRHPLTVTTAEALAPEITEAAVEDAHGAATEVTFHFRAVQGLVLTVQLRLYVTRPFVLLRVLCANEGNIPVALRRFFFRSLPDRLRPTAPPTGFYRMD